MTDETPTALTTELAEARRERDEARKVSGNAIEALWQHHTGDWHDCDCVRMIRAWRDFHGLNGDPNQPSENGVNND